MVVVVLSVEVEQNPFVFSTLRPDGSPHLCSWTDGGHGRDQHSSVVCKLDEKVGAVI